MTKRGREPLWFQPRPEHRARMPRDTRAWLLDSASLTARLRAVCGSDFRVHVLRQAWARPQESEAAVLCMRTGEPALVREVHLLCRDQAWVYARTVIPRPTLRGRCARLARLGTRPLGEVLFSDPGMRRGGVEVARIVGGNPIYWRALQGTEAQPLAIWGRRSIFRIEDRSLLVSEIFLPNIAPFPGRL